MPFSGPFIDEDAVPAASHTRQHLIFIEIYGRGFEVESQLFSASLYVLIVLSFFPCALWLALRDLICSYIRSSLRDAKRRGSKLI